MTRRAFFSTFAVALFSGPQIMRAITQPRLIYFNGQTDYLKMSPFAPGEWRYLPGVSGNYASVSDPGWGIEGDIDTGPIRIS